MLKKILLFLALIFIILFTKSILMISTNRIPINKKVLINSYKEKPIGNLVINKINLNQDIYSKYSKLNTVEENIELLKESNEHLIIIAGHSGSGRIAYFNRLNELNKDDEVILMLNKNKSTYIVTNSYEQIKDGYINISKEEQDQLILTTCSPNHNGYQLIVNCIKKEST